MAAQIYLGARTVYFLIYAFNITVVRTLIWSIATGAIGVLLICAI